MKSMYFTYDGLLDPLGQSQIMPYLERLAAAGHEFTIVSYEKDRPAVEVDAFAEKLRRLGIDWHRLTFRSQRFGFPRRVMAGVFLLRKLCMKTRPDLVHLRGLMPAVIYQLARLRIPYLYDFRGFALEEWTEIGKLRAGSLGHRMLRRIDRRAVRRAAGLVVLEKPAEVLLRQTYPVPEVPLKVIRTCTDTGRFGLRAGEPEGDGRALRFVFLGGARYPYLPEHALRLVAQFRAAGVDARIDFFNERDHEQITAAVEEIGFPRAAVEVRHVAHAAVPAQLSNYDCGLVFCESSPWRRVCSPTKVGEYLAAGLPVISLVGIDALDALAARTDCVRTVKDPMAADQVPALMAFIGARGVASACQALAREEFDLARAGRLYIQLYAEIEARAR